MNLINELSIYFADLVSPEWAWGSVFINLFVMILSLFFFKHIISFMTGVSFRYEIAEKDNSAFGIVTGFSFLSLFIIMSAAATGSDEISIIDEFKLMFCYNISGMLMLVLGKVIFDKFAMKSFCLQTEIKNGNFAAAIIDGGNLLSTSLIVFAYMGWVKGTSLQPILIVAYGWVLSQIMLSSLSFIREKLYKKYDGISLQDAIKNGNIAVAIRYSSYKLSFALTPLIAAPHYSYAELDAWWLATAIIISSILLSVLISLLTFVSKIIIVPKVDYSDEINQQENIGLSVVESFIVLGITIAFYGLLK